MSDALTPNDILVRLALAAVLVYILWRNSR
jgi:hypothetical protein